MDFLTRGMYICFLQSCSFSLHKMLIDGLEMCGLLVNYCDVFVSCLDSYSDGTYSLQSIHCEQAMKCYISQNLLLCFPFRPIS